MKQTPFKYFVLIKFQGSTKAPVRYKEFPNSEAGRITAEIEAMNLSSLKGIEASTIKERQ